MQEEKPFESCQVVCERSVGWEPAHTRSVIKYQLRANRKGVDGVVMHVK